MDVENDCGQAWLAANVVYVLDGGQRTDKQEEGEEAQEEESDVHCECCYNWWKLDEVMPSITSIPDRCEYAAPQQVV
jgi:hypothetical protein